MSSPRFGWHELLAGNRFPAPVSEESLLAAGRAMRLSPGLTLVEAGCGNGAACVFLAEGFHLYARGLEAHAELLEVARERVELSAARARIRLFHEDPDRPDPSHGPADALCALD
ncbi:MAG: SAM-dependent methyltransferase, partial [Planctomycetota bacterium]